MDKKVVVQPYDVTYSVIKRNESFLHTHESQKDCAKLKKPDRKLYTLFILNIYSLLYFNYTSINLFIYLFLNIFIGV